MASAMPVLPEVESMITLPGRSSPRSSPTSTILRTARSLTEPPGLNVSSLAKMRTPGRRIPAVMRRISSSGVSPIRSITLAARATGTCWRSAAAGDRRDDGNVVAILYRGVELVEEADVVAVEIDVDEPANLALVIPQPLPDPRMAPFQVIDDLF